ncbi:MAG: ribonuclease H-like domain-containing protein, partial [Terriglobales bacterium]
PTVANPSAADSEPSLALLSCGDFSNRSMMGEPFFMKISLRFSESAVLVEEVDKCVRHQFWADAHNGEATLWTSLAAKLNELNCAVFHFGRYETKFLQCMEQRYGRQSLTPPDAGGPTFFDVYGAIRANVYFPAYSNSLKSVARILGATWSGPLESS